VPPVCFSSLPACCPPAIRPTICVSGPAFLRRVHFSHTSSCLSHCPAQNLFDLCPCATLSGSLIPPYPYIHSSLNSCFLTSPDSNPPCLKFSLPHDLPFSHLPCSTSSLPYTLPASLLHTHPSSQHPCFTTSLPHVLPASLPHSFPTSLPDTSLPDSHSLPYSLSHTFPAFLPHNLYASLTHILPAPLSPHLTPLLHL
jgi:hypothetical protein